MGRIMAHQKALGAVLHTVSTRHHIGNPAGSLRIEKLYDIPELFSGPGDPTPDEHHTGNYKYDFWALLHRAAL